jgi:hypothetical protein
METRIFTNIASVSGPCAIVRAQATGGVLLVAWPWRGDKKGVKSFISRARFMPALPVTFAGVRLTALCKEDNGHSAVLLFVSIGKERPQYCASLSTRNPESVCFLFGDGPTN